MESKVILVIEFWLMQGESNRDEQTEWKGRCQVLLPEVDRRFGGRYRNMTSKVIPYLASLPTSIR